MGPGNASDARRSRALKRTVLMGQRLMLQAERDLKFARVVFQPEGYYLTVFLAHQAAEKSLKAAGWHLRGEEPPWKHGLDHAAQLLVDDPRAIPATVSAAISVLNPIVEQTRYPSGNVADPIPSDLVPEHVAQAAIEAAQEVMAWARLLLQEKPGRLRPRTSS